MNCFSILRVLWSKIFSFVCVRTRPYVGEGPPKKYIGPKMVVLGYFRPTPPPQPPQNSGKSEYGQARNIPIRSTVASYIKKEYPFSYTAQLNDELYPTFASERKNEPKMMKKKWRPKRVKGANNWAIFDSTILGQLDSDVSGR